MKETETTIFRTKNLVPGVSCIRMPLQTAQDSRLTFGALGLLTKILAMPSSWDFNRTELRKLGRTGREKFDNFMAELKTAGYLDQEKTRTVTGRIGGCKYTIYNYSDPRKSVVSQFVHTADLGKNVPYVVVPFKTVWDEQLSLEALGMLTHLLSRPDNWKLNRNQLQNHDDIGSSKVARIIDELRRAGRIHMILLRYVSGQFKRWRYEIYDGPDWEVPTMKCFHGPRAKGGMPQSGNPANGFTSSRKNWHLDKPHSRKKSRAAKEEQKFLKATQALITSCIGDQAMLDAIGGLKPLV